MCGPSAWPVLVSYRRNPPELTAATRPEGLNAVGRFANGLPPTSRAASRGRRRPAKSQMRTRAEALVAKAWPSGLNATV